ncbi:nitrilotriacetate monooxygenase [Verrucomicrobia bacterium LW23]|nr:nitrilotriacetate monooxygenase [Verrucomicrobia bacterium LW23]
MSRHNSTSRKLKLIAFLGWTGHHAGSWRHPSSNPNAGLDIDHHIAEAQEAERALFDAVFIADGDGWKSGTKLEPFTQLSAVAVHTSHIGLINTVGTVYNDPYSLARYFASLDLISGGRAGWNVVTGAHSAAEQFTRGGHPSHADRYEAANEFVEVVKQLWASWDEGAFVADKQRGILIDPARVNEINFRGRHYQVRGPLDLPPSPQGHTVIVQAGSSEPGKELAARTAELVFTAQQTLPAAQEFYRDLKGRLARYGRSRDDLFITPGFAPLIGETEAEARDLEHELNSYVDTRRALDLLSERFTVNLNDYPIDGPVPLDKAKSADDFDNVKSRQDVVLDPARREGFTIRQLLYRANGGHGHVTHTGTPLQIADFIDKWFNSNAVDGFVIEPPLLPQQFRLFVDKVIPELQNRGLFRTAYEGTTLRRNLGLRGTLPLAKAA